MPILRPGLVFVHIPKCAGTSLEVAAGFDQDYPTLGLAPTSAAEDRVRLFGGGLEHLSIREIRHSYADVAGPGSRSFSIVRDPVDRFVSHFVWRFYRFNEHPPPVSHMLGELQAFIERELLPARAHPAFVRARDGLLYDGTPQSLHPNDLFRHLAPQCAFLFDRGVPAVDELYDMHSLGELTARLHREYGLPESLPHRMVGPSSTALRRALPPDVEDLLQSAYEMDETFLEEVRLAQR